MQTNYKCLLIWTKITGSTWQYLPSLLSCSVRIGKFPRCRLSKLPVCRDWTKTRKGRGQLIVLTFCFFPDVIRKDLWPSPHFFIYLLCNKHQTWRLSEACKHTLIYRIKKIKKITDSIALCVFPTQVCFYWIDREFGTIAIMKVDENLMVVVSVHNSISIDVVNLQYHLPKCSPKLWQSPQCFTGNFKHSVFLSLAFCFYLHLASFLKWFRHTKHSMLKYDKFSSS